MERFIRRENIKHYRELLKTVRDETERQRIQKLMAEELQKAKDAVNSPLVWSDFNAPLGSHWEPRQTRRLRPGAGLVLSLPLR
jgi:hypothetical protein